MYFSSYFNENKNNISNLWKGIKSLITIKSKTSSSCMTLSNGTTQISDPIEVAKIFNNFFVDIGPKLAKTISNSKCLFSNFLKNSSLNSFYLKPTDEDEISKIISSLNNNKSLGPCSVPDFILKDNINIISKPISALINQSFQQGILPELLKTAQVIPVYKKGDSTICSNYRPISLLSIFSKIFEKCMYSRIYAFLTKYNLIYKRQVDFVFSVNARIVKNLAHLSILFYF